MSLHPSPPPHPHPHPHPPSHPPARPARYIKLGTCTSVLQVWLGLGPMQIAMTATVVVEALLFMPASPDEGGEATRLHDSLQKFGW